MEIREDWIDKLIEIQNVSKVAKAFKRSRQSVWEYFNKLQNKGILNRRNGHWYLEDKDKLLIELHGFMAKMPISGFNELILELLMREGESINITEQPKQIKIFFRSIKGFYIKIMGDTLIFVQRKDCPIRLPRSIEAIDRLNDILQNQIREKIPLLERKLGCKIGADIELHLDIMQRHIAFLSDALAKKFIADQEHLKVYINGELRTVIDLSKGKERPELEDVHKIHAPTDAKRWEKLVEMTNTGEFKPEATNESIKNLARISEIQTKEYAENIRLHLEVMRRMDTTLAKIEHKLDPMNLFEDI